jgi:hypothetical protein
MKKVIRPKTMTLPILPPDDASTLIELTEWAQVGPEQIPALGEQSLMENVLSHPRTEALRSRLDIRRSYHGLARLIHGTALEGWRM